MKAATIAVRIVDFLKQHPPYAYLEEKDLLALAQNGRVRLHEGGEIVFTKGQPRDRYILVIQQGKVRIVDERPEGDRLIDLRGEGDMLGLQGVIHDEPYRATAKTESDTIVYALDREQFIAVMERSPKAKRYLAAYFTLNPAYDGRDPAVTLDSQGGGLGLTTLRKGGLGEVAEPQRIAREALVTVPFHEPLREVARRLHKKMVQCVLVVDAAGRPLGKITDGDLRDRVFDGSLRLDAQAGEMMFTDLVAAPSADSTGTLLIKLTRSGKRFIVITEDGTLSTRAVGIVAERSMFLQYGRFPTVIGEAISEATDVEALRALRDRMETLILEFLENREALPWMMEMTGVLNRKMVQRIIELERAAMEREGWVHPGLQHSWLMMGSGGRDELLIRSAVYDALIYEDPPPGDEDAAELAARYFRSLASRVGESIRQCGFGESEQGVLAQMPGWCLPLSAMKARFQSLIESPLDNLVYDSRDAFDFRPVVYGCPLARELRHFIESTISQYPAFIGHMAGDSLLNQPPRTIFRGYVVDERGIEREELEIKSHALLPLVDAARVLAMEGGRLYPTNTRERLLEVAARLRPDQPEIASLLEEAAAAFLVAYFARVSRGLIAGTDGAVIRPAYLDSETRTQLKTAFRTILEVLEMLAARYGRALRS
ncbi:MAG: cyclic nucleotide-binding domain-containing protein [Opitutales bacterium]|nr:cyclic nucleotide-binding domain-containing protein [Opitutales bacterium]